MQAVQKNAGAANGPKRPKSTLFGLRWVPVPLAVLAAVAGWLVLGSLQGQAAAHARHTRGYQASGLALNVESMVWMSNDMNNGPVRSGNTNNGFQMPDSMMPGMQKAGDNRLRVEVDLRNAGTGVQRYSISDFRANGSAFREFTTIFSDREPLLGHSIMEYYLDSDHSYVDYNEASLTDREPTDQAGGGNNSICSLSCPDPFPLWLAKSDSIVGGADPPTPVFKAMAGDPVRWRFLDASGDDPTSFQIAGHSFPLDHGLTGSQLIEARTVLPGETFDAFLVGGAGGATRATGDYEYSVGRNPMVKSGDWGIFRVVPPTDTSIRPL